MNKKILIVDDDETNLILMKYCFTDAHHIETACNGEEGLRKLQREHFDLIISDVNMPAMNGIEMYLEAEKRDPHIKKRILFITATENYGEIDFLRERRLPYLEKPSPLGKIREMVRRITGS